MSKITFRAEDGLVERVEGLDTSKSEVMREALRSYLDEHEPARGGAGGREATIDELVAERVDTMLDERMEASGGGRDLDITISLEGVEGAGRVDATATSGASDVEAPPSESGAHACEQCGTDLDADHVYCPNCGEKASRRVFCDCGDELRSDWAFCPSCGQRTPAADVLDGG